MLVLVCSYSRDSPTAFIFAMAEQQSNTYWSGWWGWGAWLTVQCFPLQKSSRIGSFFIKCSLVIDRVVWVSVYVPCRTCHDLFRGKDLARSSSLLWPQRRLLTKMMIRRSGIETTPLPNNIGKYLFFSFLKWEDWYHPADLNLFMKLVREMVILFGIISWFGTVTSQVSFTAWKHQTWVTAPRKSAVRLHKRALVTVTH